MISLARVIVNPLNEIEIVMRGILYPLPKMESKKAHPSYQKFKCHDLLSNPLQK